MTHHPSYSMLLKKYAIQLSFVVATVVASCTVTLAPRYDQTIINNLSSSSEEVFELLAHVSKGVDKSSFEKREERYNQVIGRLEALTVQVDARPMPDNKALQKIIAKANERLAAREGNTTLTVGTTAPSVTALQQIVKSLEMMKSTDQESGLKIVQVNTFKNGIKLFLDQAMTYEKFLNEY